MCGFELARGLLSRGEVAAGLKGVRDVPFVADWPPCALRELNSILLFSLGSVTFDGEGGG